MSTIPLETSYQLTDLNHDWFSSPSKGASLRRRRTSYGRVLDQKNRVSVIHPARFSRRPSARSDQRNLRPTREAHPGTEATRPDRAPDRAEREFLSSRSTGHSPVAAHACITLGSDAPFRFPPSSLVSSRCHRPSSGGGGAVFLRPPPGAECAPGSSCENRP